MCKSIPFEIEGIGNIGTGSGREEVLHELNLLKQFAKNRIEPGESGGKKQLSCPNIVELIDDFETARGWHIILGGSGIGAYTLDTVLRKDKHLRDANRLKLWIR